MRKYDKQNLYFFTYGIEGHPFCGGWTEVLAENKRLAIATFRVVHPDIIPGFLNCADVYTKKQFEGTGMNESGNYNAFCHELIALRRYQRDGSEKGHV